MKLTAKDKSGNEKTDILSFERTDGEDEQKEIKAGFRVKRPSYCSDYEADTFIMPKEKRSITVKEEGAAVSGETGWYIDGRKEAEGKKAEIDFSRFQEREEHTILALYKDGEEYRYSRDITKNGAVAEAGKDGDVKAEENFVSFRLTGTGEKVKASTARENAIQTTQIGRASCRERV